MDVKYYIIHRIHILGLASISFYFHTSFSIHKTIDKRIYFGWYYKWLKRFVTQLFFFSKSIFSLRKKLTIETIVSMKFINTRRKWIFTVLKCISINKEIRKQYTIHLYAIYETTLLITDHLSMYQLIYVVSRTFTLRYL